MRPTSPNPAAAPNPARVVASGQILPPLADPDAVRETFANEVLVQVRDGAVQFAFCSTRTVGTDLQGAAIFGRVIAARVAMAIPVANAMLECCRQLGVAMQLNQAVPGAEGGPGKGN